MKSIKLQKPVRSDIVINSVLIKINRINHQQVFSAVKVLIELLAVTVTVKMSK